MGNVKLSLTFANYHRLWPLALGDVKPEGIDLDFIRGHRPDMLRRAATDPTVDGGEGSVGQHVRRIDQGDRRLVALPIFCLRNFTARDLYVVKGGPIKTVADLVGKRVGMYQFYASGSVWYRHFLRQSGVNHDAVKWTIGSIDEPVHPTSEPPYPAGVSRAEDGKSVAQMLLEGKLDAMYSPYFPKAYHPTNGPLVKLVPNFQPVELEYFKKSRCFPPQHLVVIKRDSWDKAPQIGKSLVNAFQAAEDAFNAGQALFPYSTPWQEAELELVTPLMGQNYAPHGLNDVTRHELEVFTETAHWAGLTSRKVGVDELFPEYLAT